MLIQTHQLDDKQLQALEMLRAKCVQTDGNQIALYSHLLSTNRGRPSNILYYNEQLIGFLAAFFFYDNACEIALMIAPEHRRQNIGSQMLRAIIPLIKSEGIENLIFSTPHALYDEWLPTCGFRYMGSEYQMQRLSKEPISIEASSLVVRLAKAQDIPTLCAIGQACFHHENEEDDHSDRFERLINNAMHRVFIILKDGVALGKAHLHWENNCARLSDIAVLPNAQKQGLGGMLLAHCINHALTKKRYDLRLDVESNNKQALGLYTRLGFQINNVHDYWSISEIALTAFLDHL